MVPERGAAAAAAAVAPRASDALSALSAVPLAQHVLERTVSHSPGWPGLGVRDTAAQVQPGGYDGFFGSQQVYVYGGVESLQQYVYGDALLSTDGGRSFVELNQTAAFPSTSSLPGLPSPPLVLPIGVRMSDGDVLLMGGLSLSVDTIYRSADGGLQYSPLTTAPWALRHGCFDSQCGTYAAIVVRGLVQQSVHGAHPAYTDEHVLVMGGSRSDCWVSLVFEANGSAAIAGSLWSQQTANTGIPQAMTAGIAALPWVSLQYASTAPCTFTGNSSVMYSGGYPWWAGAYVSNDLGHSWAYVETPFSARWGPQLLAYGAQHDPAQPSAASTGLFLMLGGLDSAFVFHSDVWLTHDLGQTWLELQVLGGLYPGGLAFAFAVIANNSLQLWGGQTNFYAGAAGSQPSSSGASAAMLVTPASYVAGIWLSALSSPQYLAAAVGSSNPILVAYSSDLVGDEMYLECDVLDDVSYAFYGLGVAVVPSPSSGAVLVDITVSTALPPSRSFYIGCFIVPLHVQLLYPYTQYLYANASVTVPGPMTVGPGSWLLILDDSQALPMALGESRNLTLAYSSTVTDDSAYVQCSLYANASFASYELLYAQGAVTLPSAGAGLLHAGSGQHRGSAAAAADLPVLLFHRAHSRRQQPGRADAEPRPVHHHCARHRQQQQLRLVRGCQLHRLCCAERGADLERAVRGRRAGPGHASRGDGRPAAALHFQLVQQHLERRTERLCGCRRLPRCQAASTARTAPACPPLPPTPVMLQSSVCRCPARRRLLMARTISPSFSWGRHSLPCSTCRPAASCSWPSGTPTIWTTTVRLKSPSAWRHCRPRCLTAHQPLSTCWTSHPRCRPC